VAWEINVSMCVLAQTVWSDKEYVTVSGLQSGSVSRMSWASLASVHSLVQFLTLPPLFNSGSLMMRPGPGLRFQGPPAPTFCSQQFAKAHCKVCVADMFTTSSEMAMSVAHHYTLHVQWDAAASSTQSQP
jgi:hypothetical protein